MPLPSGNYTIEVLVGSAFGMYPAVASPVLEVSIGGFNGTGGGGSGIPAGGITDADVNTTAGIQLTKLADAGGFLRMTSAERTKLSGVASGATANSSDATLLNRANHTGTQAQSTIVNLTSDLAARALQVDLLRRTPPPILQNGDGSWPSRLTATTDRTSQVEWVGTFPPGPSFGPGVDQAVIGLDEMLVTVQVPQ